MIAVKAKYLEGLREMDNPCFVGEVKKLIKEGLQNSRPLQDVFVSNKILRYRLQYIIEYIMWKRNRRTSMPFSTIGTSKTARHNVLQGNKIKHVCFDFKSDLSGLTTRTRRSTEIHLVEPLKN